MRTRQQIKQDIAGLGVPPEEMERMVDYIMTREADARASVEAQVPPPEPAPPFLACPNGCGMYIYTDIPHACPGILKSNKENDHGSQPTNAS